VKMLNKNAMSTYVTKRGMRISNPAKKVRRMKRELGSLGI
jgi:hypothetical protein